MLHVPYALIALCLLGFVLSGYAYAVEQRAAAAKQLGHGYRAYCDIGPFSCTKVFSSDFGSATQFFGLPKTSNAAVGMAFYAAEVLLCLGLVRRGGARGCVHRTCLLLLRLSSGLSVGVSAALAYVLVFVLHDLCLVCCSIYVVNIATCVLCMRQRREAIKRD
ncbi:vitamin-K-epoxide reductase (warfarin-sensitive) [Strigomonas culicis]|uniref:vitamin-K-epoxide reductase (warfarin-sensitive) n=1 Tax=Strigomonas culicis TaxID=28005 RepID=S9UWF8_9TRYP|nr:vitamin-K-epoxide reductase (warfarin-sensitive) [Strigomonas culicis]|eukprot:EPY33208.1 vitamin-K-epoxide reductase (warfarin-sensitive) [Strigomonas culicis]